MRALEPGGMSRGCPATCPLIRHRQLSCSSWGSCAARPCNNCWFDRALPALHVHMHVQLALPTLSLASTAVISAGVGPWLRRLAWASKCLTSCCSSFQGTCRPAFQLCAGAGQADHDAADQAGSAGEGVRLSARDHGERVLLTCHMLKTLPVPVAPHQVPCLALQVFWFPALPAGSDCFFADPCLAACNALQNAWHGMEVGSHEWVEKSCIASTCTWWPPLP